MRRGGIRCYLNQAGQLPSRQRFNSKLRTAATVMGDPICLRDAIENRGQHLIITDTLVEGIHHPFDLRSPGDVRFDGQLGNHLMLMLRRKERLSESPELSTHFTGGRLASSVLSYDKAFSLGSPMENHATPLSIVSPWGVTLPWNT